VLLEGFCNLKNPDLPACSIVPQPTMLQHAFHEETGVLFTKDKQQKYFRNTSEYYELFQPVSCRLTHG
jgi:hypothetical protein